jgi:hypothetical protein
VSGIVERMARAICAKSFEDPGTYWGVDPIPVAVDKHWPDYVDEARAALLAAREALDAPILEAMRQTLPADGHEWEFIEREELSNGMVIDPALACWQAMIDAALGEEERL